MLVQVDLGLGPCCARCLGWKHSRHMKLCVKISRVEGWEGMHVISDEMRCKGFTTALTCYLLAAKC